MVCSHSLHGEKSCSNKGSSVACDKGDSVRYEFQTRWPNELGGGGVWMELRGGGIPISEKGAKRVEGLNNLAGNSFSLLSSVDSSYLKDLAVDIGVGLQKRWMILITS
jgi:hypothetical protein